MFFIKEKQMYPEELLADQVDPSHGKTFPSFSMYPPRLPHFLKTVDFVLYWIIQWVEPNITVKIYDEKKWEQDLE
jgi:hypothetical protein